MWCNFKNLHFSRIMKMMFFLINLHPEKFHKQTHYLKCKYVYFLAPLFQTCTCRLWNVIQGSPTLSLKYVFHHKNVICLLNFINEKKIKNIYTGGIHAFNKVIAPTMDIMAINCSCLKFWHALWLAMSYGGLHFFLTNQTTTFR